MSWEKQYACQLSGSRNAAQVYLQQVASGAGKTIRSAKRNMLLHGCPAH